MTSIPHLTTHIDNNALNTNMLLIILFQNDKSKNIVCVKCFTILNNELPKEHWKICSQKTRDQKRSLREVLSGKSTF